MEIQFARSVRAGVVAGFVSSMAACSYTPPPVPVGGDENTLGFLAGEWAGTYRGVQSGRTGSIFLRLSAGADTAYGEVLMTSMAGMHPSTEAPPDVGGAVPPVLRITFFRAVGDRVYGSLDEYRDPECGCRLHTDFSGRVEPDRIAGTFTTTHVETGVRHEGSWDAERTGPPPRDPTPPLAAEPLPDPPGADTLGEPGLKGPSRAEMVALGQALFQDLGCAFCHGETAEGRVGPDLSPAAEHKSFEWVYRMIVNPDSMTRNDPTARAMTEAYGVRMPDRGATPWEALVLYEYLISRIDDPDPRR